MERTTNKENSLNSEVSNKPKKDSRNLFNLRWFRNSNIRMKIMSGFFAIMILLLGMGIPVLVNTYNTDQMFENVVSKDTKILLNTQKLIKLIVDMETGQRGFIITGEENFLEPYNNGIIEFDKTIKELKELLVDNIGQLDKLRTIQLSVEKWQNLAAIPEIEMGRKVAKSGEFREQLNALLAKDQASDLQADIHAILRRIALNFELAGSSRGSIAVLNVSSNLHKMEAAHLSYLLTGKANFIDQYKAIKKQIPNQLDKLTSQSAQSLKNRKLINELKILVANGIQNNSNTTLSLRGEINNSPETASDVRTLLANAVGKNILDGIRQDFEEFISYNDQQALIHFKSAKESSSSTIQIIWLIVLLAPIIAIFIGFQLSNSISTALEKLIEASRKIANGEKDVRLSISTNDEIGKLSRQMNYMAANIQESVEKSEEQDWIKTTISDGHNLSRKVEGVRELLHKTSSYLTQVMNANVGAIYLLRKEDPEVKLEIGLMQNKDTKGYHLYLDSTYAYKKRKNISNKLNVGEGLIGQVAHEWKSILITDVPDDYIKISSGLGEHAPKSIIATPIIFEEVLYGVIELASFGSFSEIQENVITEIAKGLGYSIHNIIGKQRTEALLDVTQKKSEELEEQTARLKASEEELRVQQEELAQTNAELEEKAQLLESVNENVTDQNQTLKQAREVIRQKAEELEVSSRYKSEFLSNMSHELRTPLNSILVLSQLLQDNDEDALTSEQLEFASIIHKSGSELLELINEVLDLAKIESGKMDINVQEVSPNDIVRSMQDTFLAISESNKIEYKVHLSPEVPKTIETDTVRLKQILKNLLSNAFKFTDEGGEVKFSIDLIPTRADFIEEKLLKEEKVLKIAVSDTGIGIAQDKLAQVFEAFQQADGTTERKYGGTGLGLSITKELVKNLGGEIRLESKVDIGSTFTVFLPVVIEASAPIASSFPEQTIPTKLAKNTEIIENSEFGGKGKKFQTIIADDRETFTKDDDLILIVEDDLTFAKILLDFSRSQGYKGIVVNQGDLALPYVEAYNPTAILLDIQLPIMDGWTILKKLKASNYADIPVHIMSGNDNTKLGMDLGAMSYLVKPIQKEQLDQVFSHLVDQPNKQGATLIVEDNESQSIAIRSLFDKHGMATIPAYTAKEAKNILQRKDIVSIVLDIGLPDNKDFDFLSYIKKEHEEIPTVVFTGRDLSKEEINQINDLGNTSIVLKGAQSGDRIIRETELFLKHIKKPAKHKPVLSELPNTLKGKKILIVDDDIRNIYTLKAVFKNQELDILTATNGLEALDVMKQDEDVDLILMDIMMPEMDGYQATRELRKNPKFEKLPILALTAKAMKGDREKCLEAGASDYITKPVDTEQLLSLMRVWLYEN